MNRFHKTVMPSGIMCQIDDVAFMSTIRTVAEPVNGPVEDQDAFIEVVKMGFSVILSVSKYTETILKEREADGTDLVMNSPLFNVTTLN